MFTRLLRQAVIVTCVLVVSLVRVASGQIVHDRGQNVVPVYEGWERNADGTFTMVFGYFNRNLEEEPFVPIGPNNMFEPGEIDRGQPTHFYPRRQQFMFKVPIPKDWGTKDLIWTLVSKGRTEKAYGSLLPVYEIGPIVYEQNRGNVLLHHPSEPVNRPPSIELLGSPRLTRRLTETVDLKVSVTDDGLPPLPPRHRRLRQRTLGPEAGPPGQAVIKLDPDWRLGVTWIHHRGPGVVTFDPMRQGIEDGLAGDVTTSVRFSEPGHYVLRAYADDGVLTTPVDVAISVK